MLEFKIIEKLLPNEEFLNAINTFDKKIINGKIKTILNTNLKVIKPTTYIIKYSIKLTILEYQIKCSIKKILELLKSQNN